MQRRLREVVNEQCREFGTAFSPQFGELPSTLKYGDSPVVGASPRFARSDHRHGFPSAGARITIPERGAIHVWRWRTPKNAAGDRDIVVANQAVALPDGAGDFTSYEGLRINISNAGGYALFAQNPSGTYTLDDSNHDPQRLRQLDCRWRIFNFGTSDGSGPVPAYNEYLIGGIKAATPAPGQLGPHMVTQGIYFRLRLSASSATQVTSWDLVACKDGIETVTETNAVLPLVEVGVPVRFRHRYQNFRIEFDGSVAQFSIDGAVVGTVKSGFPTSKIAGWGIFAKPLNSNTLSTPDFIQLDSLQFEGVR